MLQARPHLAGYFVDPAPKNSDFSRFFEAKHASIEGVVLHAFDRIDAIEIQCWTPYLDTPAEHHWIERKAEDADLAMRAVEELHNILSGVAVVTFRRAKLFGIPLQRNQAEFHSANKAPTDSVKTFAWADAKLQ